MWTAIVILGFIFLWLAIYDNLGGWPILQKIFLWGGIFLVITYLVIGYMIIMSFTNMVRGWFGL